MRARLVFTLAMLAILQGCGTLPRLDAVPLTLTERAVIPGIPNARIWQDRDLKSFVEMVIRDTNREIKILEGEGKPTERLQLCSAFVESEFAGSNPRWGIARMQRSGSSETTARYWRREGFELGQVTL